MANLWQRPPGGLRRVCRYGFTLVELLVSIAIIGVLVSLLVTAVQVARDASRRIACASNLRQVGLAIALYEDTHRQLPMAAYGRPYTKFPDDPKRIIGSVFTRLLPFLEQQNLADIFDVKQDWYREDNQIAVNIPMPILRCPSSPGADFQTGLRGPLPDSFPQRTAAVTDYTAVYSWGYPYAIPGPNFMQDIWGTGALSPLHEDGSYRKPRRSYTTDGASRTLAFVERAASTERWVARKMVDPKPSTSADWAPWAGQGCVWILSYSDGGKNYAPTGLGPCNVNCSNHQGIYAFHNGGANTLMLDGHVAFLTEAIEAELLYAYVTRSRGEHVEAP